jgi:hypothetical protein
MRSFRQGSCSITKYLVAPGFPIRENALDDDMLTLTETNKNLQAGPSMCTVVISQPSQIVENSALFLQSAWIALRMRVSHHPAELFKHRHFELNILQENQYPDIHTRSRLPI